MCVCMHACMTDLGSSKDNFVYDNGAILCEKSNIFLCSENSVQNGNNNSV